MGSLPAQGGGLRLDHLKALMILAAAGGPGIESQKVPHRTPSAEGEAPVPEGDVEGDTFETPKTQPAPTPDAPEKAADGKDGEDGSDTPSKKLSGPR